MLHFTVSKSESHKVFLSYKGQPISKSVMAFSSETNSHVQHSNDRKEFLEQENRVLHEEIAAMRTKMEEMTENMRTMVVARAQTPLPPPVRTQVEASSSAILEWTMCVDTPTHSAPQRSMPWFPPLTAGEVLRPASCESSSG